MLAIGCCYTCGKAFTFNPTWVPSVPASLTETGEKEPVCATCIAIANPERVKRGLPEIKPHRSAYYPTGDGDDEWPDTW